MYVLCNKEFNGTFKLMERVLKFGPNVPITFQIKQLQDIKENMQAHSTQYPFIYFSKILLNPKCWGKDQGSQAAFRAYKHSYQEIYDQVVKNMPEQTAVAGNLGCVVQYSLKKIFCNRFSGPRRSLKSEGRVQ